MRIRLPAGEAPFGVVVFSHGLGGNREGGDVWGRAWARAGLAVVHVQHPGSDTEALRGGMAVLRQAASEANLVVRVQDVRFVVRELLERHQNGAFAWQRLRPEVLGMAGHSFGARTTQAVAGERFPTGDSLIEPRFKAFAAFSPNLGPGEVNEFEKFGAISKPFLCLTGSQDEDPFLPGVAPRRLRVFGGLPAGAKAQLVLSGADHYTFAGNSQAIRSGGVIQRLAPAPEREAEHHALVARLTSLWWRAHLLGDASAQGALRGWSGLEAGDSWAVG